MQVELLIPESSPILAWRVWDVGTDGSLMSPVLETYCWPVDGLKAVCVRRECGAETCDNPPQAECRCGIRGFSDPDDLLSSSGYLVAHGHFADMFCPASIAGIAAFWGRAFAQSSSYAQFEIRAEFARPIALGPQWPNSQAELALRAIKKYRIPLMDAEQLSARVAEGPSIERLFSTKHGPYGLCLVSNR